MSTVMSPLTGVGLPRSRVATGLAVTASVERYNATVYELTFVEWSADAVKIKVVGDDVALTVIEAAVEVRVAPLLSYARAVRL